MKKIISYILLMLWMLFIFMLSNQTSNVSGGTSGSLIYDTLSFVTGVFGINESDISNFVEIIHGPIREIMHTLEYLILAILVMNVLYVSKIKSNIVLKSIIFCFIYSLSDEIHQIFIDGRTFQFLDLFMDAIGYILGSLIFNKLLIKKDK